MSKPLVSVIMPVYKVEQYIERSVRSVIDQTYNNIEVILVDDGTPDRSVDIAEALLEKSNVSYSIIRQENSGLGYARNAGLNASHGDWVLFLDSDDMLCVNAIEVMTQHCGEDVDFIFSGYNEIHDPNEALKYCTVSNTKTYGGKILQEKFLYREIIILAPGTLYNRKILDDNNLRFDKIPWSEDQFFIWRLLHEAKKAIYIEAEIYQYLLRDNSIMTSTKLDKMLSSFQKIASLSELYSDVSEIGKYIVPRWVMGTINSASRILDFRDWKELWKRIDGKNNFRLLLSFNSRTVKTGAVIGLLCPGLYYRLSKKRR